MEKLFSCLILLVAAVLVVPGCFAAESPVTMDVNTTEVNENPGEATMVNVTNETEITPIGEEMPVNTTYMADVNTTSLAMALDETVLVSLAENPTTGFMWNATNSTGLEIVNDTYVMDNAPEGMVGVGGVHEWILKAVEAGNQTFSAVYMRSWETRTGDENSYSLNITVG